MAASKYLNLEEAATQLGISADELKKLRERGDIRGFADRGTWKFKVDDVLDLVRKRQADSDPEVPLMDFGDEEISADSGDENFLLESDTFNLGQASDSDSDIRLMGSSDDFAIDSESDINLSGLNSDSDVRLSDDEDDYETVSGVVLPADSADDMDLSGSDSDVKLIGEDSESDVNLMAEDGDSDVNLIAEDSDSDVKLVGDDSDSDVSLISEDDSDSDVKLVDSETLLEVDQLQEEPDFSETENLLQLDDDGASDVQLLSDEPDFAASDDLVLDDLGVRGNDDSGISLAGDSALMLGDESGMSLDAPLSLDDEEDEGITLSLDDDSGISLVGDSGISLDTGDSGISLESVGDSGISLEDDHFSGTVPMMNALSDDDVPATQFEIPSLNEESSYELNLDDTADTGVLDLSANDSAELDDAVFDVDEDADDDEFEADEDLDMEEDAFDDEEMGVFDSADDDVFAGDDDDEFSPRQGARAMGGTEAEWGTGIVLALGFSMGLMVLLGAALLDLVLNTATSSSTNVVSTSLLGIFGGMLK